MLTLLDRSGSIYELFSLDQSRSGSVFMDKSRPISMLFVFNQSGCSLACSQYMKSGHIQPVSP